MKFFIKKRINSNKQNKIKSKDILLNNKSNLQKDNKKITDENIVEITNSSNSNDKEINKELQLHNEEEETCNNCKEKLDEGWKKPHWKWNLDKNIKICLKCYEIKELEYEKLMNTCAVCNSKLKFIRYNPKPEWKLKGQLCRKCWDSKNYNYKNDKQ